MWGADNDNDEGGFNVTMTQSPVAGAEQKQNTVITVAIRELLENNEENKNTHAVVVGIIKQVKKFLIYYFKGVKYYYTYLLLTINCSFLFLGGNTNIKKCVHN